MVWNLAKGTSKVDWVNKIHKFSQSLKGKLSFYQKKKKNDVKFVRRSGYFAMLVVQHFKNGNVFFLGFYY